MSLRGGDQNFRRAKDFRFLFYRQGEPEFFPISKGELEFFHAAKRGGQKKLATGDHKQTASLSVNNDSCLRQNVTCTLQ